MVLANGIQREILGFIETKRVRKVYRLSGINIYEVVQEYDYLIVATIYSSEVYKLCAKLGLDMTRVVFLKKGGMRHLIRTKGYGRFLGEKNYTVYLAEFGVWKNTYFEDDMDNY